MKKVPIINPSRNHSSNKLSRALSSKLFEKEHYDVLFLFEKKPERTSIK